MSKDQLVKILNESKKNKLNCSEDVKHYLDTNLPQSDDQEVVTIIFLTSDNNVIAHEVLFKGGLNATVFDKRLLWKRAISHKACKSIIIAHNHPSGNIKPSGKDTAIAKQIKIAGDEIMDISLLDFIIYNSKHEYFSYAHEGLFDK